MIDPILFTQHLKSKGLKRVFGVPDSLLGDFIREIDQQWPKNQHTIVANEGLAVSMGAGHYLATQELPLVYMQNSGLGNAINPLTSLTHQSVFSIPMLLVIGWRGEMIDDETQIQDEPQHCAMGKITVSLLNTLGIPHLELSAASDYSEILTKMIDTATAELHPTAILVRKDTFLHTDEPITTINNQQMSRRDALIAITANTPEEVAVVATTGYTSRELLQIIESKPDYKLNPFYLVGSMGHTGAVASAIAECVGKQKVICIDGDGSMLMHMGALVHSAKNTNLIHIVLNNGRHDSVGGQPLDTKSISLASIAEASGYELTFQVAEKDHLSASLKYAIQVNKSVFIEVFCAGPTTKIPGRPKESPLYYRNKFVQYLKVNKEDE